MKRENQVFFKNIKKVILEQIELSSTNVIIAVAWISDTSIINLLVRAQHRNVKISMVFYNDRKIDKDLYADLHLEGANIKYSNKLMHNKFCIIDNRVLLTGSYNGLTM